EDDGDGKADDGVCERGAAGVVARVGYARKGAAACDCAGGAARGARDEGSVELFHTSGGMNYHQLWSLIRADPIRARGTLSDAAEKHEYIAQYQEFLDHNELELACDRLEAYGENHGVCREFWLALRDAASKMELSDHVR